MKKKSTVYEVTYNLLRELELTTIFGNPGSTEQPFLKNFPPDFSYILGLQEASVVAMADGYAQATKKPVLVSLHTSTGTGHAMGNIMTAYMNKSPLILLAGQQTRKMILGEPMLTNRDETMLPRPWIKWAYQPVRAQDVPGAIMRAFAMALQPPAGPVYLSVPFDDWDQPALGDIAPRSVSQRVASDPERLKQFACWINKSRKPVLIYGQGLERSGGWEAGIQFAEKLHCPVFIAPLSERISFPFNHPQFRGVLPMSMGHLSECLQGHDLAIVVGAQVFRYYPYVEGPVLPQGMKLLQITSDPYEASSAFVGDSLLGDAMLTIESLIELIDSSNDRERLKPLKSPLPKVSSDTEPLYAVEVFSSIAELRPKNAILVIETPSNTLDLLTAWPITEPNSFYTCASGGLGWGGPASVGIALAQKNQSTARPVITVIGDGSIQYSIQSLYTAAQQQLRIIFLVPCNEEYGILKDFAQLEQTPHVPALDLPGLDIVSIAKGFGCSAIKVKTKVEIREAFSRAIKNDGPTVITVPIRHEDRILR